MAHKTVPITLVSIFSQSLCESLYNSLTFLGYKNIETIDGKSVLATDWGKTRIFVLPVSCDRQSGFAPDILTVFKHIRHQPVLGILPPETQAWNREALRFCNEFLHWPCDKAEVDLRMERLTGLLKSSPLKGNKNQVQKEFLSLNMIGSSPSFLQVLDQIRKIARCDATAYIEGESGTGKELTARAIHYLSDRRDHPFIPVNCGAIPDSLLENELFGHQQGAFTDARTNQEGLVSQAEGGTLFLDEVETFSQKGQVVLLRFLQDFQYKALGGNTSKHANIRIIAACNVKLQDLVNKEQFRRDLYYRLDIMPIKMPSLAQRDNDVLELANYFLNKFRIQYNHPEKQLDPDSIQSLTQYSWPGNIRELENMLHREFWLSDGPLIKLNTFRPIPGERRKRNIDRRQERYLKKPLQEAKAEIVSRFEKEYLARLLDETDGNVTRAAQKAGKERRCMGKLIKKYGIDKTFPDIC